MQEVFETLYMLLEGDKDSVHEIATDCYTQLKEDFPKIVTALHKGDLSLAKKFAHKLKGSVMNFKTNEMIEHFVQLENLIDQANTKQATSICKEIEKDIHIFKGYVDTLIK